MWKVRLLFCCQVGRETMQLAGWFLLRGPGKNRAGRHHCQVKMDLAVPEIVPMPFVTESFNIALIVPIAESDMSELLNQVGKFTKISIEKGNIVFLYSPERPDKNNKNDFFKEAKQMALKTSKKYTKKGKGSSGLLWYSVQTKGVRPSDLELLDLVTQKDNSLAWVPEHGDQTGLLQQSPHEHHRWTPGLLSHSLCQVPPAPSSQSCRSDQDLGGHLGPWTLRESQWPPRQLLQAGLSASQGPSAAAPDTQPGPS